MQVRGATPPVERRAASVTHQTVPEPKPAKRRRSFDWVITACGHVNADDMEIVAVGSLVSGLDAGVHVYCDQCQAWAKVISKARLRDLMRRIGLVPLPVPDEPPF